jgi:hypothetical protein
MVEAETDIPQDDDEEMDDWLHGPDGPGGDVDPELAELTPSIHYHRPIIMIAVMCFAVYLLQRYTEEIQYFLSVTETHAVGEVTDFPARSSADKDWKLEIPHNRFVEVAGIPSRTSLSCKSRPPTRYFKLVGAHVYIEQPIDDLSTFECEQQTQRRTQYEIEDTAFFEGRGRAISMQQAGERYQAFRAFYEKTYGELFCASLDPARMEQRKSFMRQVLRNKHRAENGADPTEAELEAALAKETLCHDAWLIQIAKEPRQLGSWVVFPIVLCLIILWDIVALLLWVRRTVRVLRG